MRHVLQQGKKVVAKSETKSSVPRGRLHPQPHVLVQRPVATSKTLPAVRLAKTVMRRPQSHPLPPNDPVAILGVQPLVNVQETNEDYTMGQNDFAVIASGSVTITLTPNPLAATPVLIIADSGTVTIEGGENTIQGGNVTLSQGSMSFLSFSPVSGEWSVSAGGGGGGGVADVTASSPIASSGGADPNISFAIAGQAQGDIIYFNGTNWVRLGASTAGDVLTTEGAGQNPQWTSIAATVANVTSATTPHTLQSSDTLAVAQDSGAQQLEVIMPVTPVKGQIITVKHATTSQNAVKVTSNSIPIEDPNTPGTLVTGSVFIQPSSSGANAVSWIYNGTTFYAVGGF